MAGSSITAFARAWRVVRAVLWAGSCDEAVQDVDLSRRRWFSRSLIARFSRPTAEVIAQPLGALALTTYTVAVAILGVALTSRRDVT